MIPEDELSSIVGIDEVGRGCLAGPVVAAAVVLGSPIVGLKDSKLIPKKTREKLSKEILVSAISVGVGVVDVDEINEHGLTAAIKTAMISALGQINSSYKSIIIDGNFNFLIGVQNVQTIIKADNLYPSVSAASIVAKVYRDSYMTEIAKRYPEYGFDKHVGYGTKLHLEMLEQYGPTPIHRMFYKPLLKYKLL